MIGSIAPVALLGLAGLPRLAAAAESPFKVESRDDIIASSKDLAFDLMALYNGNETGEIPGILSLPPPGGEYWFWEAAGFFGTFIDYWHLTGDESYNDVVTQGMLHQVGPNNNFLSPNWTVSLGNDDQCFWALSALLAAENQFPNPPQDQPPWIEIAENVFGNLQERWEIERANGSCGGGLRWQVAPFNAGYDYKNCKYYWASYHG